MFGIPIRIHLTFLFIVVWFASVSAGQGANVALANTVWPQLGPGATVQVASHGHPGLVVHARTSTAAKPVCNAVPCGTMGGTKAALRLAVRGAVNAALGD